jgi:type 1 glutamine amidotransferase
MAMLTIHTVFASLALLMPTPTPPGYEQGATLRVYEIGRPLQQLATLVPDQTPNVDRLIPTIDLEGADGFGGLGDRFVAEVIGNIWIETPGLYGFAISSDDGARFSINARPVLDNDGVHAVTRKTGQVELAAGLHPFHIDFFENEGGQALKLEWKPPGTSNWVVVPQHALATRAGVTRVVSPGYKRLMGDAGVLRPGCGLPLVEVHPGFEVTTIRPDDFEPQVGAMTLGPDGSLYFATFAPNQNGWLDGLRTQPDGVVWQIPDPTLPRDEIEIRRIADGFFEPAGMVSMDGNLYVSQRSEVTRLVDQDRDGFYETHITVGNGWVADNYHHFTFGLAARNHLLYATLSTAIALDGNEIQKYGYRGLNGPNPPNRGTLVEINPETGAVRYIAGGFRTPNGIGLGPDGQMFVSDNQGAWNPHNSLYAIEPGSFYGHYNTTKPGKKYPGGGYAGPFDDMPPTPASIALPQSEVSNSPTVPAVIPAGPFAGQLYLGELTGGGIRRVFLEEINGTTQGAVFRFTQGLESGVNRLAVAPDGTIYIGGTGAGGNWNWRGTTFGLQRLDPAPDAVYPFEIFSVEAIAGGFRLTFTRPADTARLADPEAYAVRQWYYAPTAEYGGAKREQEKLVISKVTPSTDGRSVELMLPQLRPGRVVHLAVDIPDSNGEALWSNEAWYTLNTMPATRANKGFDMRVLVFSKTAGFRHASIEAGIKAVRELGQLYHFDVHATEDAAVFNNANLPKYDAVVFLNTTGDVLDEAQQQAFERYVRRGGGFVGVHSATDTEYDWPWYGRLVGAWFAGHPRIQDAVVVVQNRKHPATRHLPARWQRRDEWYNFRAQPKGVTVLASLDIDSYEGSTMDPHPIAWCHEFDGGRAFYTEGGHTKASYSDPAFRQHLVGGIFWAGDQSKRFFDEADAIKARREGRPNESKP